MLIDCDCFGRGLTCSNLHEVIESILSDHCLLRELSDNSRIVDEVDLRVDHCDVEVGMSESDRVDDQLTRKVVGKTGLSSITQEGSVREVHTAIRVDVVVFVVQWKDSFNVVAHVVEGSMDEE